MDREDVKQRIRRVIIKTTNLKAERIGDQTSFRQELDLDSLSLLEIGVDVDYEFGLGLPDERYRGLDTVDQTADLVLAELAARQGQAASG
jgi:acyl carrier protein